MKKFAVLMLGVSLFTVGCGNGKKTESELKSEIAKLASSENFVGACDLGSENGCMNLHLSVNPTSTDFAQVQSKINSLCKSQFQGEFWADQKCNVSNLAAFCKITQSFQGKTVEIDFFIAEGNDLVEAKKVCNQFDGKFINK